MEVWGIEGQYSELQSIFIARVLEIVGNLPKKAIGKKNILCSKKKW